MDKLSTQLKEQIADRPTNTYLRNQSAFVEQQYKTMPKARPQRTNIKIPNSFDGRKVWGNLLSPVMNQGSCGSCWAFASTSTLADRFNIQSLGLLDLQLSPVKLILCDFKGKEFQVKHPETDPGQFAQLNTQNLQSNACYGNTLYDAWRYLYVIGTNTEKCLPYNDRFNKDREQDFKSLSKFQKATELPLCTVIAGKIGDMCSDVRYDSETGEERGTPSRFYRALHFYAIAGTPQDKGNEYNIRHNIYCWGPVSSGFDVYPDFYTFDAKNDVYEWNGQGPRVGGHAIEIVGWGEEHNKKYWIIRNSWGKEWGDNGYFKMIRGTNNCRLEENIITGVPDFFYPENYKLPYNKIWLENPKTQFQRHEIEDEISITGGGIDSTTGYTRRVMVTRPWLNLSRPVNLSDLPNWNTFVAGIDSHPRKRYRYQNLIKQKHRDVIYDKNVLWLVVIVVTILLVLILLVLYKNYKNEKSLENIE